MVAAASLGPICQSASVTGAKSDGSVAAGSGVLLGVGGGGVRVGATAVSVGAIVAMGVGGLRVGWAQAAHSKPPASSTARVARIVAILPSATFTPGRKMPP